MTTANLSRLPWLGILVICLVGVAEAADEQLLQEVIVTAQRRSENVQDVPMSISVLDSKDLEERGVTSFIDYGTTVPNLGFGYSGFGFSQARTISIRGVAGNNTTGFYLDDTPVPETIDPRVMDINRIEVLRGPQGTLYGARSEGGTVRLITNQPNPDSFDAKVHMQVSDTWNTVEPNYIADAVINLPLIPDRLAVRIMGLYDSEAGFFRRTFPANPPFGPVQDTVNDVAHNWTRGGSISATWKVSDAFSITPRILYQETRGNGLPYSDHGAYEVPEPAVVPPLNLNPDNFTQKRLYDVPENTSDRWTLSSLTLSYHTDLGDLVSSTSFFDRNTSDVEDSSDFNYQIFEIPFNTPTPSLTNEKEFVQEVRFSSVLNHGWEYVAGVYYENITGVPIYLPPVIAAGLNQDFGGTAANPAEGTNPLNPDEIVGEYEHQTQSEPALFGEVSYHATDKLKLTAGARVYQITTRAYDWQEGLAVGGPRFSDPEETLKQAGINPKVQADYQVEKDKMVYATVSKGFRPGGFAPAVTPSPAFGCAQSLASIGVTDAQTRQFHSDSLWNYEVGEKSSWLDHRLTINAAGFYIDWKNLQQFIELTCGFNFIGNVGAAKSEGFELEVNSRPLPGLQLSGGLGYQHAEITASGPTSPQKPGSPVFQVPNWTANLAATYTHAITNKLSFVGTGTYAYVGHSESGDVNPAEPRLRRAYRLLDARLGFGWERFEFAIIGKNLQNTHANLADSLPIAAEVIGRPRIVTNQPRTVGLDFRARF